MCQGSGEIQSYYLAHDICNRVDLFGVGGARREAERLVVPFLGEVPLTMDVRETSDAGTPVVVSAPDGAQAQAYRAIAAKVQERIAAEQAAAKAATPAIVFD